MPHLSAAPISLTLAQAEELQRLARAHKTPRKLAERAAMILRSAAGTAVREIARQLELWPKTVRHGRACWLASAADTPVTARLSDAARPGAPATFTPEQVCALMALACEPPEPSDLPLSQVERRQKAENRTGKGSAVDRCPGRSRGGYFDLRAALTAAALKGIYG